MKKHYLYIVSLVLLLASCAKEEKALVLPPPGDLTKVVADIGTDYSKDVYISLANNTQHSSNWKDWDLAFEADANGAYVYLNTGKFMWAANTGTTNFATADSTGKEWKIDNDALEDDSNAIGKWRMNTAGSSNVIAIDRGKLFYTGISAGQRYKKIRLDQVTTENYTFSYCDYGNNTPVSFTIPKNHSYSLMYFSFDNGGKIVEMAPPKEEWDFVLTRYTHIYYGEPIGSPYRYYLVNGGLNNKWNGISGTRISKDTTQGFVPFKDFNAANAANLITSTAANTIGFEWKLVDINTSSYTIVPDVYYVVKDKNGYYYKVRFIDFYGEHGERGVITFEYQRL